MPERRTILVTDDSSANRDLLAGQILWVGYAQLALPFAATAVILALWFGMQKRLSQLGFYLVFALAVTVSVQLVGVYLVFASPVTTQTSPLWSLWVEVETLSLRSLVLVVPFGLLYLQRTGARPKAPIVAAAVRA